MQRTKDQINAAVNKVLKAAEKNTEGTILSKMAIKKVIKGCNADPSPYEVDELLRSHQTAKGVFVFTGDIIQSLIALEAIHRKKINTWLPVKYATAEMLEMGLSVSRKNGEVALKELNKKSAASQFKAEIEKLQAEISDLGEKIITGEHTESIECDVVYYYKDNRKTIIRADTKETIFDDVIPDYERQTELYDKDETEVDKELEKEKEAHEELVGHEIHPELEKQLNQRAIKENTPQEP